jgi:hypothetical protein
MTTMRRGHGVAAPVAAALLAGLACGMPGTASAQDLASRVAAVRDGRVEVRFTAREGVCGDGRTFVRLGEHQFHGTWNSDTPRRECVPGPVRVVARIAGGRVEELRGYVGPGPSVREGEAAVTDLGTVPAPEAARWLMDVARTAEGRVAQHAIMPAVLADSAVVWRDLLAIARDDSGRSRQTRREAAHWLSTFASAAIDGRPNDIVSGRDDRDESDEVEAKKAAVFALSQLRDNAGVPQLVQVARTNREPAVRRQALFWLGQSGDKRGLDVMEEVLSRADR